MNLVKTRLVVDGMIVAYKVHSTLGWMATKAGDPTGLRFGFLRAMMAYEQKWNAAEIVIAWDLPGPINKVVGSEDAGNYKTNRKHSDAEKKMFEELPRLRELLMKTKWTQMWQEGYEADDLIACYVGASRIDKVVIISTDADLQQLVSENVSIWTAGKSDKIITPKEVKETWGVNPNQLALLRSALGDKSDNLPPIMPLKMVQEEFRQFLGRNPQITSAEELTEDGYLNIEALKKREKLMRPLMPYRLTLYSGEPDAVYLKTQFEAMESKSLPAQLTKMV